MRKIKKTKNQAKIVKTLEWSTVDELPRDHWVNSDRKRSYRDRAHIALQAHVIRPDKYGGGEQISTPVTVFLYWSGSLWHSFIFTPNGSGYGSHNYQSNAIHWAIDDAGYKLSKPISSGEAATADALAAIARLEYKNAVVHVDGSIY